MNENARAWVAALRSGKYKQGKRALHPTPDTYCCLGVACDLYQRAMGESWQNDNSSILSFWGNAQVLPPRVRLWLGLTFPTSTYLKEDGRTYESLANLNDRGVTFNEIADLIESEPEGLFLPVGKKRLE